MKVEGTNLRIHRKNYNENDYNCIIYYNCNWLITQLVRVKSQLYYEMKSHSLPTLYC